MVSRVLRYREWSRVEACVVFFLLAVIVSEIAAIFLLGQEAGEVLSKAFASISAGGITALGRLWKWIYKMVGPMVFPLLILTALEMWGIYRLVMHWTVSLKSHVPENLYKILGIVEGAAPGFGFLGTCISLIFTMHRMDPNLTQSAMLKVLLENSSSAFGSTVYGISLAITAFISKELFKGFLIKPEAVEIRKEKSLKEQDDAGSMNLIRREV
jgi:hypothetical protein